MSLYFNESKFSSILGRKALMGQIFKNISKNEKYTVLYGEKGLEKVNFAESLCVYLAERYIINDYEIFRIKSEFDYNYMLDKINENIDDFDSIIFRKFNVIIIKFDFENDDISYQYLINIYKKLFYFNNLHFIFILDAKEIRVLENININNCFKAELNKHSSRNLLKHLLNGIHLKLAYIY